MSEQSFLDYAMGPDELSSAIGQKVQYLVSLATEMATSISYQRTEKAREAAAQGEAAERQFRARQDAEYEADRLVWRRVWNGRWWDRATPEQIGRAWQAVTPWAADGFPSARATVEHMRQEIKHRYGVDVDPVQVDGSGLAEMLGVDSGRTGGEVETGEPQQGEPRVQTINYIIRDRQNDGDIVARDLIHLAPEEGDGVIQMLAAQRLAEYVQQHDGGPERGYAIEVYQGREAQTARPLHIMDHQAAEQLNQRRAAIVTGDRSADAAAEQAEGGGAEVRDALQVERRALRAELREMANRGWHEAGFQVDAEGQASEIGRDPADIRDALGRVGVRLEAVEADLRGEDGDLAVRGAALRHELSGDWWDTAYPEEIAGVWNEVGQWSPGQARDRALDNLRQGMVRTYGIDVTPDASAADVLRRVHRGRAEARGERPYGYRIEEAAPPGSDRAARAAAQGRTSAPEGDSPHQVAQRLLSSYSGDLDKARAQNLRVVLTDDQGRPILSLSADDLPEGIVEHDGEDLWRRSRAQDTEAQLADETGDHLQSRGASPDLVEGEHEWAAEQRLAAEQNRAAAGVYDRLAEEGDEVAAEGAESAWDVNHAYDVGVSVRLQQSAQTSRRDGPGRSGQGRGLGRRPKSDPDIGR